MNVRAPPRPIRRLLPATVERIAAGEVVERPASVVKELAENAIDAGARTVVVRIWGGGIDRVEVADDGEGIPPEELELAVERHATSKIEPEGPVEEIASLGFRGEALASIGAVARLRLLSRPRNREIGEGISVVGGGVVGRFASPRAPGTTAEVEDLFFATPARRKFLKSPAAEQVEVTRIVEGLYLAQPSISFRLDSEGRELLLLPSTTNLTDAAASIVSPSFRGSSFRVTGGVPGGRLYGALGLISESAPTSSRLFLAVNGRPVTSRPIVQAVRAAFGDALPRARFPSGVIHLELDPSSIDVNVHPTKREIRFLRERELTDAVRERVREALLGAPLAAEAGFAPEPPLPKFVAARPAPVGRSPGTVGALRPPGQQTLERPPRTAEVSASTITGAGPKFSILGVLDALYWVAATDDGLALIDQHAASERLLFESLRRNGTLARQVLVEPVTVRLSASQRTAWEAHADVVRSAGFELDPFGPDSMRVRSVPTYRAHAAHPEAVRDLLDELASGGRPTLPDGLVDRTAATIACHAAIRAGDPVEANEIGRIVASLDSLPERARTCPHGRPIFVRISRARLDRWFLRSGV